MSKTKCIALALVAALSVSVAYAVTVTNLGETFTVTTMADVANAGTQAKSLIVDPDAGKDRRGFYAIQYTVPAAGITGAVDLVAFDIPQGTIFGSGAIVEVETALLPSAGTAAIACGGAAITSAGNLLESTGISYLTCDTTPAISTADDKPYVTIAGTTATQGVFTVYLPVILGNAQ